MRSVWLKISPELFRGLYCDYKSHLSSVRGLYCDWESQLWERVILWLRISALWNIYTVTAHLSSGRDFYCDWDWEVILWLIISRVVNSLIGFSSDSLIFCEQKSDSLVKQTESLPLLLSFVMSESLTVALLQRVTGVNHSSQSLKKIEWAKSNGSNLPVGIKRI